MDAGKGASDSRSSGLWWDVGGLANMVSCCAPQTQAQRALLVDPAGTEGEAPERRTKKKKKKKTAIANPNGSDANGQAAHQGRGEESQLCMQPTTGNSSREANALTASPEAPNPALPHHVSPPPLHSADTLHHTETRQEDAPVQEKRGVVFKKGLGLTGTGWRERYLVLQHNRNQFDLQYFESKASFEGGKKSKGKISIKGCNVYSLDDAGAHEETLAKGPHGTASKFKHDFNKSLYTWIIHDTIQRRKFEMGCKTERDRGEWISCLQDISSASKQTKL